jgi:hypothetical protein
MLHTLSKQDLVSPPAGRARPRSQPLSQTTTERWRMTWEQRFSALIELGDEEWDAAHKRVEQEWLAAYTAAFR